MTKSKKIILGSSLLVAMVVVLGTGVPSIQAALGSLLATVTLPGNSGCNVGIAFDGTYVMTIDDGACFGQEIGIYTPPAGDGAATLVATKTVKDAAGALVDISAIDWDSSRGKLWATYNGAVYLVDIGNPAVSGDALATFQFNTGVGGIALTDGLAWDSNDDTLYVSPDVNCNVYQFSLGTGVNPALGTLMNTVSPENAAGVVDCDVSGVAIGSGNTLYIGRNGNAEIRRVDKTTGDFVSTFATTAGRVEDLVCDPVTYAPLEAILAKDAFNSLYEAFEVDAGTCPLPVEPDVIPPKAACVPTTNPAGKNIPTAPAKGGQGQNQDGYYQLFGSDDVAVASIVVVDSTPSFISDPFTDGDKIKLTQAPGVTPSDNRPGPGVIVSHLKLKGDAILRVTDTSGNVTETSCLVPPPPK